MRIRKNANLSSLTMLSQQTSGTEALQTHVCQLNQSPWDVIPFSQDAAYQSTHLYQYEGEDSFNGNGSLGDSVGAVESSNVASLMEEDPEDKVAAAIKIKVDNMVIIDDNYEMEGSANPGKKKMFREDCEFKLKKGDNKVHCCQRSDCKNERKEGHYLCDHHSSLLKSYNNNNGTCIPTSPSMKKPAEKTLAPGTRRGRAKAAKKGQASSSNPYEFYYYSGFGPLWGKRRGEANKKESKETVINGSGATVAATHYDTTPFSSPSPIEHHGELDFVDEDDYDDDEDSENGDIGKKRMRKPVKARSLKSLM